jgi:hypothetical protein
MTTPKDPDLPAFVEVYRTRTQHEVAFIRSVLDPEDIAYYIDNETANRVIPFGHGANALEMRVMVERARALEAREILREALRL